MPKARIALKEIRREIDAKGAKWKAGRTYLSDLSSDELQLRLGFTPGPGALSLEQREARAQVELDASRAEPSAVDVATAPPAMYDLRDVNGRNFITPVRSQGGCGACVAFGTLAAMEGTLKVSLNDPGLNVDFSEAHLFYCHARAL